MNSRPNLESRNSAGRPHFRLLAAAALVVSVFGLMIAALTGIAPLMDYLPWVVGALLCAGAGVLTVRARPLRRLAQGLVRPHARWATGLLVAVVLFVLALAAPVSMAADNPSSPLQAGSAELLAPDALIQVNSTADVIANDGQCTLREAIINANNDDQSGSTDCAAGSGTDTINVPAGAYSLSIPETNENASADGDLDIRASVSIVGAGAQSTIIDGNSVSDNVIHILNDITVAISGVTIRGGNDDGIEIEHGATVTVLNTNILDNDRAGIRLADSLVGGDPTLILIDSTVSRNAWDGILDEDDGTVEATNSTISLNGDDGVEVDGTATLLHVTIYENGDDGIDNDGGTVNLTNSIVANNFDDDCQDDPINDNGDNLDSDGTCSVGTTADPLLGPLADNGGPTLTHALLPGSPAIDNSACDVPADQRGVPRPQGPTCDIGAYERSVVDLSISKTDNPDPVYAGQELFYEVTVSNNSNAVALDVDVTDTLPLDVEYLADTDNCTFSPGTGPGGEDQLFCDLGDIGPGASRSFQIKTRVAADAVATEPDGTIAVINTAEVDSDAFDPNPANNTVTQGTFIEDLADLKVVKMSKPDDQVLAGEPFIYTIFVENLGPSWARGVKVRDDILSSGTFEILSIDLQASRAGACTPTPPIVGDFETIECELTEPLEPKGATPANPNSPSGQWIIQLEVTATETQDVNNLVEVFTGPGQDVVNQVTWENGTPDPNTANNQATDFIAVLDTSNLALTKEALGQSMDLIGVINNVADEATAGLQLTYSLRVNNAGPSTAENVVVEDNLPAEVDVVSVSGLEPDGTDATCNAGTPGDPSDPTTCNFDSLGTGDNGTMTIVVQVKPDAVTDPVTDQKIIHNDAWTYSDHFDPDNSDNLATNTTTVNARADLELQKFAVGTPRAGGVIHYEYQIDNLGPSVSRDVSLRDFLPDEVEFLSAFVDVEGGIGGVPLACDITVGSNALFCPLGDIAPTNGVPIFVFVNVHIKSDVPDSTDITNDADVFLTDTPDPDTDNNSDSATVTVLTTADVSIQKMSDPEKVNAGEQKAYEIWVTNHGPSDAQDVTVYDILPDEVVYEVDTSPFMCTQPDNLVGFRALLSGDNEVPPADTPATGRAQFVLNTETDPNTNTNELIYSINVNDINDITAAHIHEAPAGVNGPVVVTLFSGSPPDFDPTNPLVGSVDIPAALAGQIQADPAGFYVNVHTTDFPAGEIRGQLAATVNSPLKCELGTLKPDESRHFKIFVEVRPETPPDTSIVNVAIVTSETTLGDPDLTNNEDKAKNLVLNEADLKITKFGKPDGEVRAGDILTYTVIVDNLGPSWATGVAVKDILQSDLTFDFLGVTSDRPATCTSEPDPDAGEPYNIPPEAGAATGVPERLEIDCTLDAPLEVLAADGPPNSGRWILTMHVTADETQDINNVAHVLSDAADPNPDNNQAFVEHDITDVADLALTKTAVGEVQVPGEEGLVFDITTPGTPFPETTNYATDPNQVTAGRRIMYTLTVNNAGPSTAENVLVTDRLPPGVTIYPGSLTTSQGSCETGTPGNPLDRMACGLGTILPDGSATITFEVLVDPSLAAGSVLENDAFVTSDIFDPENDDNHTHTLTTVNTWADMTITKLSVGQNKTGYDQDLRRFIFEDLPGQVTAGHELRYEITVQNNGASDAQNVQVVDLLPDFFAGTPHLAVTFLRAEGAACRPDDEFAQEMFPAGPPPVEGQLLVCDVGTVPAGARKTFDVYVHVDPSVPDGTILDNGAWVLWGPASPPAQPPDLFPGEPQIPPTLPTTDDPFTDNNFAVNNTTVNAVADVFITKVDVPAEARLDEPFEPDKAIAGNEHRYLITFGNHGWSVARDVAVNDTLDIKQAGILGETFVRCEPVDPDDQVSCSEAAGVVTLDELLVANDAVISAGTGELNPGDEFSFWLITQVDPGYVLDADDFLAENTASISTSTTDFRTGNNQDTEQTLIIARADLEIDKMDSTFVVEPIGDPVEAGGTINYTIDIFNNGPSDAAEVLFTDWLPSDGVVLVPETIQVFLDGVELDCDTPLTQPTSDSICFVRDDGRIQVIVGNDPNNEGTPETGRLNAGNSAQIKIVVLVGTDAEAGTLLNRARVETRQNNTMWPPAPDLVPGIGGGPRTPTADPDLSNNEDTEETLVVAPSIQIEKTVSLDGTCPGTENVAIGFIGEPVTYCYEITNTGDTYLDFIHVVDTVQTRSGPYTIFDQTFRGNPDGDPNVPLAPGDSFIITNTEPDLDILIDCNDRPDTAVVTAIPVNRGRTCLLPEAGAAVDTGLAPQGVVQDPECRTISDEDDAVVETPCKGVDWRLQLPILNTTECDTWIQVQNVGNEVTKALLVLWGAPGACPPQSFGPIKVECTGLLRPGSAWSFADQQLPPGAQSGIVYSLNATNRVLDRDGNDLLFADLACIELFSLIRGDHGRWLRFDEAYRDRDTFFGPTGQFPGDQLVLDFGANQGEPLAVTVNRTCPDPVDPNVVSSAAYVAISTDREGVRDPRAGQFAYYAPLVWADFNGLNSIIHIQNSGVECTSVELWFYQQGDCLRPIIWDILAIAPGETVSFDPNVVVGPFWQGSVYIRTSQPMGIVVDTLGANHFGAYHAVPADVFIGENDPNNFSLGTLVNYAPLIYREHQGWETAIQVQNLSSIYNAKVKVYFVDNSGGIIKTVVDWICPRGSQTFFLPSIANLPGNWVGAARIESQNWLTPGDPPVDAPRILSVVLLEKYTDLAKTARQEAVIYNALQEMGSFDWQVGPTATTGFGGSDVLGVPFVAKGNRGITTELGIQNLNPNPGFVDFMIFMYDQNGIIDFVCEKLNEKQVEYINLDEWGVVHSGFLGSFVISTTFVEQEGGAALGAVAVERVGTVQAAPDIPGDESKAFEAFPLFNRFLIEEGPGGQVPVCPGQP